MQYETLITTMQAYGKAREEQDPDQIVALFTPDGTYQVKPGEIPLTWHAEIRSYRETYPVHDQKNIHFTLGRCNVANDTGYAERICNFDQIESGKHIEMRGIILIHMEENKIKELREYRHVQKT